MNIVPLYIKAELKQLGELQIMDSSTLDWIEKESENKVINLDFICPKITTDQFEEIKNLIPDKISFYNQSHYDSIHGISHILRVMFLTVLLSNYLKISDCYPYLVSASIHDIRRLNDNEDKGHGLRAKEWFLANKLKFKKNLDDSTLNIITETACFHETDYVDIPSQILDKYKFEIDFFKACDALDRFRQPKQKWWINPEFVELKKSLDLTSVARIFTIKSEKLILTGNDPIDSVFKIAKELFYETV